VAGLTGAFKQPHGVAAGPMAPVVSHLATLPEADVRAMASYLADINGSQPSTQPPARKLSPRFSAPSRLRGEWQAPQCPAPAGPMAPVVSHLATLPEADVRAMASYLADINGRDL
jgi:nicotinate dehydrogenase subunit B